MNAQYDVGLRPGTNPAAYVQALSAKLGRNYGASINQIGGEAATAIALAGTLTLLLSIAAGLGVLNTVVLHTRERVHSGIRSVFVYCSSCCPRCGQRPS